MLVSNKKNACLRQHDLKINIYFLQVYIWIIACLDVNPNPISFLDDLLLIICLPSSFLYGILCILPSVTSDYGEAGNVMTQVCSVN